MVAPYLSRWEGGSIEDEESEFVQICVHLSGLERGHWPSEFGTLALCERFHVAPWDLEKAPAVWTKRMQLYARTQTQAEADRAANQKEEQR